jgi:hypothetical protein
MNTKIFNHVKQNLLEIWHLPRHEPIRTTLGPDTQLDQLPWTAVKSKKFADSLSTTFGVEVPISGTVIDLVNQIDRSYMSRFFGEIWKPRTENYYWSGWRIVDEINRLNPQQVLDVGCGYHPFKGRIKNLIGIDPYNNCADYMVDILDYDVPSGSYDHVIALGSINFNSFDEIQKRFAKVVDLLAPNGSLWMRANPGITWPNGVWVDIFPWDFKTAFALAQSHCCTVDSFKQDYDRLFILFTKSDTTGSQNSAAAV